MVFSSTPPQATAEVGSAPAITTSTSPVNSTASPVNSTAPIDSESSDAADLDLVGGEFVWSHISF